jgi:hypothetical protein
MSVLELIKVLTTEKVFKRSFVLIILSEACTHTVFCKQASKFQNCTNELTASEMQMQFTQALPIGKGSERRKSLCRKSKKEHRKSKS